jgi:signal transduction histidine kinase
VSVTDNGRGFDPERVPDGRYGLSGMRERAELVGAHLTIQSRPADGTVVLLELPIPAAGAGQ